MAEETKRRWSTLLAIMLVWTLFSGLGTAAHASADDLDGHWAEESMRAWVESGLLKGYEDGTYKPDQVVTRAELVTLINRAFELTEAANSQFTDVSSSGGWIYKQVGIAVEAGYIKGYDDGSFRPERPVTREEASYMLTSLLQLDAASLNVLDVFQDVSELTDAGKQAMANMVDKGILKGLSDGVLAPRQGLTRAQAVTVLSTALEIANPTTVYDQEGVYGPESGQDILKGDVVISVAGVTLRNIKITGDLTVTSGVGEGDVFFKGVTVEGETSIQGGGPNSIHFEDSVLVRISIDKRDGSVRVVVAGQSKIEHVVVKSPVKLEESFVTDSGITNIELSDALPSGSQVELAGQFENVDVLSSKIKVKIPSGSITNLNVTSGAASNDIELSKEATILKVVLDSVAKLIGEGRIEKAVVNDGAKGSEFDKQPEKVEGAGAAPSPTPPPVVVNPGPITTPAPTDSVEPSESPEPTPSACTDDACKEASLDDISIEGPFTLMQLGADNVPTGDESFDREVLKYSIVNQVTETVTLPISVTKSTYSSAYYDISGVQGGRPILDNEIINLEIEPETDYRVNINVFSGDGIRKKSYSIIIHYPRDIQNAFKILKSSAYRYNSNGGSWGYSYYFKANVVNGDPLLGSDVIRVYRSAGDTEPLNHVPNEGSGKMANIDSDLITSTTGSFYIRIFRDGKLLHEGPYQYDLTALELITDDIGIEYVPFTKQELFERNQESSFFAAFGIKKTLDIGKLLSVVPDAKYYIFHDENIFENRSEFPVDPIVNELVKLHTSHGSLGGGTLDQISQLPFSNGGEAVNMGNHFYSQTDTDVHDRFYYVILFDEELNPIGYHISVMQLNDNQVADGYTVEHTWLPNREQ